MAVNETTLLTGEEQEAAAFAYVETVEYISENWKQIIILGVLNIISGTGCLLFPVFATQAAVLFMVTLVFAMGLLNVLTICASEHDNRQSPIFWVGFAQIVLAFLMYTNPFFTLTIITFFVAVTFMLLGGIQVAVAIQYRERMAAKVLMLVSGAAAILLSIIICLSMPMAQWYTIGVLMGVNLVNVGANRIVAGLYGRRIAASDGSHESWRSYLDADLV